MGEPSSWIPEGRSMSRLRFDDGEEFDTGGELRIERRYDGLYVVGRGWLIPVEDEDEAQREIERLKED